MPFPPYPCTHDSPSAITVVSIIFSKFVFYRFGKEIYRITEAAPERATIGERVDVRVGTSQISRMCREQIGEPEDGIILGNSIRSEAVAVSFCGVCWEDIEYVLYFGDFGFFTIILNL